MILPSLSSLLPPSFQLKKKVLDGFVKFEFQGRQKLFFLPKVHKTQLIELDFKGKKKVIIAADNDAKRKTSIQKNHWKSCYQKIYCIFSKRK
jgi:hypothetical protein